MPVRPALTLILVVAMLGPAAAEPAPDDPALADLIRESLAARPELREAEARARAERERIPLAEALPGPTLSLGIQNDGFDSIEIGRMDTSFVSIMLSQTLPWPGKRGLRGEVASLSAERAGAAVTRARLSTEADVRRAYVDLLLVRGRLELLERLSGLWEKAEILARSRYEVGSAPQSDILRAQLERSRLAQTRASLDAEGRTRVQALNRMRARPLETPIETTATLNAGVDPAPGLLERDLEDAEARSPELAAARLGVRRADRRVTLARREQYPDFGVSAGVMPRGSLEPMWQVGLSVELPILWGRTRRVAAVRESEAQAAGDRQGAETVAQILRLRVAERHAALLAVLDVLRLYREGLLVQSNATVESTLAQYRVGKLTYASVLEAVAGYLRDQDGYLQTLAAAQRIGIARAEVTLEAAGPGAGGGMGGGGVPGAGGMGASGVSAAAAGSESAPAASATGGM